MKFFIESNGSEVANRQAKEIADVLRGLYPAEVDYLVDPEQQTLDLFAEGESGSLQQLGSFYSVPSVEILELHINLFYDSTS